MNNLMMMMMVIALGSIGAFCQKSNVPKSELSIASFKTITIKKFTFSYSIDGAYLSAKVSFPTRGWVAVGFPPKQEMVGANIIIGSISPSGPDKGITIDDQYGTSPDSHKPDEEVGGENNIVDGSAIEENGTTSIFFTIPLDSGDSTDCRLIPGTRTNIIFAAGKQDDISTPHSWIAKTKIIL